MPWANSCPFSTCGTGRGAALDMFRGLQFVPGMHLHWWKSFRNWDEKLQTCCSSVLLKNDRF